MLNNILVRLAIYYLSWLGFLAGAFHFFPRMRHYVAQERDRFFIGTLSDAGADVSDLLGDIQEGLGSLADREGVNLLIDPSHTVTVVVALTLAFGVTLPITWVYRWTRLRIPAAATLGLLFLTGASAGTQREVSLEDYGLRAGEATPHELPRRLREISGLAMTADQRLLAHNDEAGIVFEIDVRDGSVVKEFQLADAADPVADDFEGIAVADGWIYLVTSSGRLYECREGGDNESVLFRMYATGAGRDCEIEGLAYDEGRRELVLMCNNARSDGLRGKLGIVRWSIDERALRGERTVIPVGDFARRVGANRFQPSGIERHPVSGNYFVVAARQAAIAEVTPGGQVLSVRRFEAPWHRQVEGIAFAPDGALIVADEGGRARGTLTVYPAPEP